jgi:hypothetical protein
MLLLSLAVSAVLVSAEAWAADAKGLILYAEPPATYVEAFEFHAFSRESVRYSTVTRNDGSRRQINTGGIVAYIPYPPTEPPLDAAQQLQQIAALLQKHPQHKLRLEAAAAKWRAVAEAPKAPVAAATPTPPSPAPAAPPAGSLTITTRDGTRYDGVTVTKVLDDVISIMHEAGTVTIPLEQLPAELQKRFNYDPVRAQGAKQARTAAVVKERAAADAQKQIAEIRAAATGANSSLEKAGNAKNLEPGKLYQHYGKLLQITDEMMLVNRLGIDDVTFDPPFAILRFEDPKKMRGVAVQSGGWVTAAIRFEKFQNVTMANGADRRLAVFSCLGFAPYGGEFIDTSGPNGVKPAGADSSIGLLGETADQIAVRFGRPQSSDAVGSFMRNQYTHQGYHNIVAFKDGKSVVVSFAKPGMSASDAARIVTEFVGAAAFQPFEPGKFHILTNDKADLETGWVWQESKPGSPQPEAVFSPRQSMLVFMADVSLWAEFFKAAIEASKR